MASIHKQARSPYYFASWRDAGGKQHFKSTKQTDRSKALQFALDIERAEKLAGQGSLTEVIARTILGEILARTTGGDPIRNPSTKTWLEGFLERTEARKSPGTLKTYTFAVNHLFEYLGERVNRPLQNLTSAELDLWVGTMDNAPGTKRLYGGIIRGAFKQALNEGILSRNPCATVALPQKGEGALTREVFTPAEVKLLVDTAEGQWKTLILVGYYTGARLSDCATMKWSGLDLIAREFRYVPQKTKKSGKQVLIPLHPELQKHLEAIAGDQPEEFVMPELAEKSASGHSGLSDYFKTIVLRAGLDLRSVERDNGRQQNKRTFHALRHSFTSALANAGVAAEVRMKLTGHSSMEVHKGYTHHETGTLRDAVNKIAAL